MPKSYIFFCQNPTKTIDIYNIPKSELREIREDLVREFKVYAAVPSYRADQTMRLLHALKILKEPISFIGESTPNEPMSYIQNACISLCMLDDGSEKNWNPLIEAAKSISALAEKLIFKKELSSITDSSVKAIFDSLECFKNLPNYKEAVLPAYNDILRAIKLTKNPPKKKEISSKK